jgi:multiphosphoryl transfer protein
MIGIVVVSHSALLAQGVVEIVDQMVQGRVPLATAGGTAIADAPIGTDPFKVLAAIDAVYSEYGVLVLMDLGSALMSAEAALDMLPAERKAHVVLCEAPLVEGAVAAAVRAMTGGSLQEVLDDARAAYTSKNAQLTSLLHLPATKAVAQLAAATAASASAAEATGPALLLTIVMPNRLGLHARPAARLVNLAAQYDAHISLAHDSHTANATSMNQVATLGVRQGDLLVVSAAGPQAEDALAAIEALALDNFGDPIEVTEPTKIIATAAAPESPHELYGVPASEGIAFGPAFIYRSKLPQVQETVGADPAQERQRLEQAIAAVTQHLQGVRASMLQRVGAGEASIFDAHLLMVRDAELMQSALQEIELRRVNAEAAWQRAIQSMATRYQVLTDPYMARRANDIIDVGQRVLRVLAGTAQDDTGLLMEEPAILVAYELKPSDLARVQPDRVLGIITELGSASDHSAILARALGLPAVTGLGPFLNQVADKQLLALDGNAGRVWLAPDEEQLQELERKGEAWAQERAIAKQSAQRPAVMRDGHRILVSANINGPSDVVLALDQGAEGVGLFRTEYLFIDRMTPPTEEEQVETYRSVARQLKGRPLIVRTLDAGGDKPLPYMRGGYEANPFLGQRGLRYSLDHPAIFKPQIRAIVRVAAEHPVKIMFPMVSTFDELVLVDALIEEAYAELQAEGLPFDDDVARGIMIETPAAIMAADYLARLVDFFSIGTNDLSQYMMAADRSNAAVAGLVSPYQPAVVRAIRQVVDAAQQARIPVSLCGELAGDPRATPLLVGMGITELSMSAPAIPLVKARVRQLDTARAQVLANELLTYETASDIEQRLSEQGN